jgi:hypothetical protein
LTVGGAFPMFRASYKADSAMVINNTGG